MEPKIDSKASIPPAYVTGARICKPFKEPRNRYPDRRASTTTLFVVPARQATSESIPVLHKHLQIRALAGRYNNPIPT